MKVGNNVTFKNRSDLEYDTAMPLGLDPLTGLRTVNRYNVNTRATLYSSFPRSSTGEYCGWQTIMKIDENSTDITADQAFALAREQA